MSTEKSKSKSTKPKSHEDKSKSTKHKSHEDKPKSTKPKSHEEKPKSTKPKPHNDKEKVEESNERYMYSRWDIHLGESELSGLGVFAARDFKKDEVVEICPYLKIYKGHMNDECEVGDYTFEFDEESEVLIQGYGSMYNHHASNNLDYFYEESDDMFEYIALRDIKKGEELTVNYGDMYWENRSEDPK
jgi:SET domain-containing protein